MITKGHQDSTRRTILLNSGDLPWKRWKEFEKNFPKELEEYVKNIIEESSEEKNLEIEKNF